MAGKHTSRGLTAKIASISVLLIIAVALLVIFFLKNRAAEQVVNSDVASDTSVVSSEILNQGQSAEISDIVSSVDKELFPTDNMRLIYISDENYDIKAVKQYGFTGVISENIDIVNKFSSAGMDSFLNTDIKGLDDIGEAKGILLNGEAALNELEKADKLLGENIPLGILADGNISNYESVISCEYVDFIAPKISFYEEAEEWEDAINEASAALFFIYSADDKDIVELTQQAEKIAHYRGSIYMCNDDFTQNSQLQALAKEWVGNDFKPIIKEKSLALLEPQATNVSTYDDELTLRLEYNYSEELIINGKKAETDNSGSIIYVVPLNIGYNEISIKNGDKIISISVQRKITVIQSISPKSSVTRDGETTLEVSASALPGATVTATLNGEKITLTQQAEEDNERYVTFGASFSLPQATAEKQYLGKVTFKGTYEGYTQTVSGGRVYVAKKEEIDEPVEKKYRQITVAVERNSENKEYGATYNPKYADDLSTPTHYVLPKGSIDYVVDEVNTVVKGVEKNYYVLSSGVMIYKSDCSLEYVDKKKENTVKAAKMTAGERYSVLTFDMTQSVAVIPTLTPLDFLHSHGSFGYLISEFDAKKAEFLFSNTVNTCDIENLTDSPLFSSYEWVAVNETQKKLVLTLKRGGVFHGFSTYFDDEGNFVIRFKNTLAAEKADNEYGYSLKGIRITVDAGHNGRYPYDSGADGYDSKYCEAEINLQYAMLIKEELESLGATVILTRDENNVTMSKDERVQKIRASECDAMIAIHQNGSEKSSKYGTSSYYFYPYAQPLAEEINKALAEAYREKIYTSGSRHQNCDKGCEFYPYYMTRIQEFPCVLIETGYITNEREYDILTDSEYQKILAKAYVRGIVNYFASLR